MDVLERLVGQGLGWKIEGNELCWHGEPLVRHSAGLILTNRVKPSEMREDVWEAFKGRILRLPPSGFEGLERERTWSRWSFEGKRAYPWEIAYGEIEGEDGTTFRLIIDPLDIRRDKISLRGCSGMLYLSWVVPLTEARFKELAGLVVENHRLGNRISSRLPLLRLIEGELRLGPGMIRVEIRTGPGPSLDRMLIWLRWKGSSYYFEIPAGSLFVISKMRCGTKSLDHSWEQNPELVNQALRALKEAIDSLPDELGVAAALIGGFAEVNWVAHELTSARAASPEAPPGGWGGASRNRSSTPPHPGPRGEGERNRPQGGEDEKRSYQGASQAIQGVSSLGRDAVLAGLPTRQAGRADLCPHKPGEATFHAGADMGAAY